MSLQQLRPGTQLGPGSVIQEVSSVTTAQTTTSVSIPLDGTVPQNTEGVQVLTATITPKYASSILRVSVHAQVGNGNASQIGVLALFQDSNANALNGCIGYSGTSVLAIPMSFEYSVVAGSTSATTFNLRLGSPQGGPASLNDYSTGTWAGTTMKAYLRITEVSA